MPGANLPNQPAIKAKQPLRVFAANEDRVWLCGAAQSKCHRLDLAGDLVISDVLKAFFDHTETTPFVKELGRR